MSDASRELPINFSSFVVSLASSAMFHLGETADPQTGAKATNLPLASQTLDVLRILQEKTDGNLDEEEDKLLATLIEDLQGRFAEAGGAAPTGGDDQA